MTIANLSGVLAGFQPTQPLTRQYNAPASANRMIDLWYSAGIGNPVGVADTTLNGVILSSSSSLVAGQIIHFDPPQGTSAYLAIFNAMSNGNAGIAYVCDRLWHNGGITITSTSLQSITSPTWPARDNNGLTQGDGVLVGLSVSSITGAGTPTAVLSYTNSSGASGRTGNFLQSPGISASTQGMFYPFTLQAGDAGVQSVQGITFTSPWASGTVNLVAYRILAIVAVATANQAYRTDPVTGGMPQVFNGTVPFPMFLPNGTLATVLSMSYTETQG